MAPLLFTTGLILALLLIAAGVVRAQGQSISGHVVDQAGGSIPNARVVVSASGHALQQTITDTHGQFTVPLHPEAELLLITGAGFVDQSIKLSDRPPGPFEIVMQVAGTEAVVTINYSDDAYQTDAISSATKTLSPLRDVPQSITIVGEEMIKRQAMQSVSDVVNYVPGVYATQGENNRDQLVIRGNSSSADFFQDGVRDDAQYYRDLYNVEQLEALKGPNAMIFGRGGGGGVINRVTKQPLASSLREVILQGGSQGNRRISADINQPLNSKAWFRVNSVYENSRSFRDHVGLNRFAVNPTVTINAGNQTQLRFGFEYLRDNRVADRGIPSFNGLPSPVDISVFFGDPKKSLVRSRVQALTTVFEHQAGKLNIRNRTLLGYYRRFYQNFVPGRTDETDETVLLSAYNNATQRSNFFNQTDLTYDLKTGSINHTFLIGSEFGHQRSKNFRQTGLFNGSSATIIVPLSNPASDYSIVFRQIPSDANNHVVAKVAATYLQDQIQLSRKFHLLAGIRFDRFDLGFHNHRNGENLRRVDSLLSPRVGVVFKPLSPLSIYGSYGVSYLPSSGDQFSSLTEITQTLKPEKFTNYEAGLKWDVRQSLSFTTAVYRLDRTNTRGIDPNDPTRIVQTGAQRSNGVELELTGRVKRFWSVTGGYAYQDAFVLRSTTRALAGARVAQVPRNSFSIWNNIGLFSHWRGGIGIVRRSSVFAALDDQVVLPAYTRADGAISYSLNDNVTIQANIENVFNATYYANADNNNNISPGSPRRVRLGLDWRF